MTKAEYSDMLLSLGATPYAAKDNLKCMGFVYGFYDVSNNDFVNFLNSVFPSVEVYDCGASGIRTFGMRYISTWTFDGLGRTRDFLADVRDLTRR